ncbi:hypothetical protein SDC9_178136 [bioreactor metagenome]|uniref:Uncharacterized protein n=1 Tax=bioreactor metagenome TaxID=1076179 RepID=A0A645GV47_9ZZZZ
MRPAHYFSELHDQRGVEVMNVQKALRVERHISKLGANHVRTIGCQNSIRPGASADVLKQFALDLKVFNNRFNHKIRLRGSRVDILRKRKICRDFIRLFLHDAAFCHTSRQIIRSPCLRLFYCGGKRITENDLIVVRAAV